MVISIVVHEVSHILMIRMLRLPIYRIDVHPMHVHICTDAMSDLQELCCAAAGPLGGAGLIFLAKWLPGIALCATFHSLYNLLPMYSTDGGRMLRCASHLLLPAKFASRLSSVVEMIVTCFLILLGIYGAFRMRGGLIPVICVAALIVSNYKHK